MDKATLEYETDALGILARRDAAGWWARPPQHRHGLNDPLAHIPVGTIWGPHASRIESLEAALRAARR